MDGIRKPREQGADAARRGEPRSFNPFGRGSESWHDWMEGFLWARTRFPGVHRGMQPAAPLWPNPR
ncbi:MAG: hypothetical protein R3B09_31680 [Nannocystaceae bacterium]